MNSGGAVTLKFATYDTLVQAKRLSRFVQIIAYQHILCLHGLRESRDRLYKLNSPHAFIFVIENKYGNVDTYANIKSYKDQNDHFVACGSREFLCVTQSDYVFFVNFWILLRGTYLELLNLFLKEMYFSKFYSKSTFQTKNTCCH